MRVQRRRQFGPQARGAGGGMLMCMFTSSPNPSDTNGGWPTTIS